MIRLLYLGVWVLAMGAVVLELLQVALPVGLDPRSVTVRIPPDKALGGYALLGIFAGSALHAIADGVVSKIRRLRWRRKPRR